MLYLDHVDQYPICLVLLRLLELIQTLLGVWRVPDGLEFSECNGDTE